MNDWAQQLLAAGALMTAVMTVLWLRQRRTGNAGIVDLGWTLGLGVLAILYALTSGGEPMRRALLALIAAAWSFRLGFHLWVRIRSEPEDGRYQTLRESWGEKAQLYFFLFFIFQAMLAVLFSIPALVVAHNPAPPGLLDLAAAALAVLSVAGEGLADRQLAAFRADPASRGKTCRQGLWRYSRHPNYFFEWLHWWCYPLLGVGSTHWWLSLGGPIVMLAFLFRITGIPATEAQALKSRGEDYRDYQATTNAFFPWFPRKHTANGGA